MPELSRFAGIVIYLLFKDTQHHNKPHVLFTTENTRPPLVLTENSLPAHCLESS